MLDGVEWAAAEIIFYMLLATLVGFAIAYIFIRWFQKDSIAEAYEAEVAAKEELARKAEHRLIESHSTLDKLQLELKGEHARVGELETQLDAAQASIAALEDAVPDDEEVAQRESEAAAAKAQIDSLTAQVADLEDKLAAAVRDRDAAGVEKDKILEQLRSDQESAASEADALRKRLSELEEQDATEPVPVAAVAPSVAAESVAPAPSQEEGLARIAEIAARTAGGQAAADDDLKKVHGIGPKLEQTLKGLGISSFRQIANFQPDDIAYVTAALDAFKGRIERDDWMGSAAEEHAKKYGEPA